MDRAGHRSWGGRCAALVVVAGLAAPGRSHAEPAMAIGAQIGLAVPDPSEPTGVVYAIRPTIGAWFTHAIGLEAQLLSSWMPQTDAFPRRRLLMPTLSVAFEPVPEDHPILIRPLIRVGGGARLWRLDDGTVTDRVDGVFTVGIGAAFPVLGALRLRTDLDAMVTAGAEDPSWNSPGISMSWTVGVEIKLGVGRDRDNDLVMDRLDACPEVPEDLDGFEDDDGCPEDDNDQDTVVDALDSCDDAPEDLDGFEDWDGCPDPDNDGDGLLDADDACPDLAADGGPNGCPDGDRDGVPDPQDACPDVVGDGPDGCVADTDGDGLPDAQDACPSQPGPDTTAGCPEDTDAGGE